MHILRPESLVVVDEGPQRPSEERGIDLGITPLDLGIPPQRHGVVDAFTTLELEHGKPLLFGKDKQKGIRLNGLDPEVVELGKGIKEDDLLFHDERAPEPSLAYLLSRMHYPHFPEPIGVFRAVERPCYEDQLYGQLKQAVGQKGEGSLDGLLAGTTTWEIS